MAHYALPHLKGSKGSIVNIAVVPAEVMTPLYKVSGSASLRGDAVFEPLLQRVQSWLTREGAVELLPYGRVNTQWLNTFPDPDEKLRTITSKIPLEKRMTTAEEIAATTVFLISSRSSHTTGQHLFVDGGYVYLDRGST
jgi:L-fucose dehydrogenase